MTEEVGEQLWQVSYRGPLLQNHFPQKVPTAVAHNERTNIAVDTIIRAPLKPQLSQSCNERYAAKHC